MAFPGILCHVSLVRTDVSEELIASIIRVTRISELGMLAVLATEARTDPQYYLSKSFQNPFPNIKFKNTSTKEMERIIRSLRLKHSQGYDEISIKILKVSAPFITSSLNYICNKSITSGIFHTCLKYSTVKPLYKKGDKENMINYKPISLLTSFSKVFEKVI
jgi:hypothetical protein